MCDPGTALIAATAALTAGGQLYGGQAQAAGYRYQARVAERNATLENEAARNALERNQMDAARLGRRVGQVSGSQVAAQAANGVDLSWGSAAQARGNTAELAAEDYASLYSQGAEEMRGFAISAANQRSGAAGARMNAGAAVTKSYFDAAGTVLSGASSAYRYRGR